MNLIGGVLQGAWQYDKVGKKWYFSDSTFPGQLLLLIKNEV